MPIIRHLDTSTAPLPTLSASQFRALITTLTPMDAQPAPLLSNTQPASQTSQPSVDPSIRLPGELWLHIFSFSKRLDDERIFASTPPNNKHLQSVVAVSHTCSYFRKLVINYPALWTTIHMHETFDSEDITRRFSRSLPHTLDVSITYSPVHPSAKEDEEITAALDILIGALDRCRSLRIRLSSERTNCPVIERLKDCRAPKLEYLSITVSHTDGSDASVVDDHVSMPHIFNKGTPALRSIRLQGLSSQFYRPPLNALTTLFLESTGNNLMLGMTTLKSILTHSYLLRTLTIRGDVIHSGTWSTQSPSSISLTHLNSLRIYSESGEMYSGMLLALDAPQLTSLTLEGVMESDLYRLWELGDPRKFSKLASFTMIAVDDLSTTSYWRTFRLFPNVEKYCTHKMTPSDSHVMQMLLRGTFKKENEPDFVPWPMLKSAHFVFDGSAECVDAITQLLKIRKEVEHPLEHVVLFPSSENAQIFANEHLVRMNHAVKLMPLVDCVGDEAYMDFPHNARI